MHKKEKEYTRITIKLPIGYHKELKYESVNVNKTIKDIVVELIKDYLYDCWCDPNCHYQGDYFCQYECDEYKNSQYCNHDCMESKENFVIDNYKYENYHLCIRLNEGLYKEFLDKISEKEDNRVRSKTDYTRRTIQSVGEALINYFIILISNKSDYNVFDIDWETIKNDTKEFKFRSLDKIKRHEHKNINENFKRPKAVKIKIPYSIYYRLEKVIKDRYKEDIKYLDCFKNLTIEEIIETLVFAYIDGRIILPNRLFKRKNLSIKINEDLLDDFKNIIESNHYDDGTVQQVGEALIKKKVSPLREGFNFNQE